MNPVRCVVLGILLLLGAVQAPTVACTCVRRADPGFVVTDGAEIPANAAGVIWWGWIDTDQGKVVNPSPRQFSIKLLDDDGSTVDIPVSLRLVRNVLLRATPRYNTDQLLLVAPERGFDPGTRYRFVYRPASPETERSRASIGTHDVTVRVSADELEDLLGLRVDLKPQEYGPLPVISLGGTCFTRVTAAQQRLKLALPQSVHRWRSSLLFAVRIDGDMVWRYRKSTCSDVVPGASEFGKGHELVFASCSVGQYGDAAIGLSEGKHTVEMFAWLPLASVSGVASKEVVLQCP